MCFSILTLSFALNKKRLPLHVYPQKNKNKNLLHMWIFYLTKHHTNKLIYYFPHLIIYFHNFIILGPMQIKEVSYISLVFCDNKIVFFFRIISGKNKKRSNLQKTTLFLCSRRELNSSFKINLRVLLLAFIVSNFSRPISPRSSQIQYHPYTCTPQRDPQPFLDSNQRQIPLVSLSQNET